MKKLLATLLSLALMALPLAALADGNWYVEEGRALALQMQALAADDAYIGLMMSRMDEETGRLREGFVQADLSKPSGAWFLALPEGEAILSALVVISGMEGDNAFAMTIGGISDVGREELIRRLPGTAASYLSSRAGIAWIMLSSAVSVGASREAPEDFRPGYLLLEYPGDSAVLVTFTGSFPGYVGASATLVPANSRETVQPVLDYARAAGLSLEMETLPVE